MRKNALVRMLTIVGVFLALGAMQPVSAAINPSGTSSRAAFAVQDGDGPGCIPVQEIEDSLDNDCDGEADNNINTTLSAGVMPCVAQPDLATFDPNGDSVLTLAELRDLAGQFPDNTMLANTISAAEAQSIVAIQYQGCVPIDTTTPCVDQAGLALLDPNKDDILTIEELEEIAGQFPDNASLGEIVSQAKDAGLSGIQYQGCEASIGVSATPPESQVTVPSGPCQDAVESVQSGEGPYADYELVPSTQVGSGNQVIIGSSGPDIIQARSGHNVVCGLGGNDVIVAGPDGAELYGNDGDDTLLGASGDDLLDGGEGSDTCDGGAGTNDVTNCEA